MSERAFFFPDSWKVSFEVSVFKNDGERSSTINHLPVSLFSVITKVFGKRIVSHLEKCGPFSDFSIVLGLLDELQTFLPLYLIELLGLLTGLGLLEL